MTTTPLSGLRVVDLSRVLAGPYATMIMADLGAEVIKVEHPNGDDARHIGPFHNGMSAYFASLNRGKQSVVLDLNNVDDRRSFDTLLDQADVLVENFRPPRMATWGYDQECLKKRWPNLVYASISGFGQTGPYADRPAYDLIIQAMSGMMSITGHDPNKPTRVGASIGDMAAGLFAVIGIVSACFAAQKHRGKEPIKGQHIDISMLDCQVSLLENALARYYASGVSPEPLGTRHPSIAPFDLFQARDGRFALAVGNDKLFQRLCRLIDRPSLIDDPRFVSNANRCDNVVILTSLLNACFRKDDCANWIRALIQADIPAGPVNTIGDIIADPQIKARQMIIGQDGCLPMAGNPVKIGHWLKAEGDIEAKKAPDLDQDGPEWCQHRQIPKPKG